MLGAAAARPIPVHVLQGREHARCAVPPGTLRPCSGPGTTRTGPASALHQHAMGDFKGLRTHLEPMDTALKLCFAQPFSHNSRRFLCANVARKGPATGLAKLHSKLEILAAKSVNLRRLHHCFTPRRSKLHRENHGSDRSRLPSGAVGRFAPIAMAVEAPVQPRGHSL